MRKLDAILKEYVARLSVDGLRMVVTKLQDRCGSDLAEALNMMSSCQDLNQWLTTAKSCDDFYDMVDTVQEYVERELAKRVPEYQHS